MLIKKLKVVLIGTKLCTFGGHDRWVGVSSSHTFAGGGGGILGRKTQSLLKQLSSQSKEVLLQLAIAVRAYLKKKHTVPYTQYAYYMDSAIQYIKLTSK